MNEASPDRNRRPLLRWIAVAAIALAATVVLYPVARLATQSYVDFKGDDAIDYVKLHGSVSTMQEVQPPLTASVVDGISVSAESFTDTMAIKLLDLPNLSRIIITTDSAKSGPIAEMPLEMMGLPASLDAIAELRARRPELKTFRQVP